MCGLLFLTKKAHFVLNQPFVQNLLDSSADNTTHMTPARACCRTTYWIICCLAQSDKCFSTPSWNDWCGSLWKKKSCPFSRSRPQKRFSSILFVTFCWHFGRSANLCALSQSSRWHLVSIKLGLKDLIEAPLIPPEEEAQIKTARVAFRQEEPFCSYNRWR